MFCCLACVSNTALLVARPASRSDASLIRMSWRRRLGPSSGESRQWRVQLTASSIIEPERNAATMSMITPDWAASLSRAARQVERLMPLSGTRLSFWPGISGNIVPILASSSVRMAASNSQRVRFISSKKGGIINIWRGCFRPRCKYCSLLPEKLYWQITPAPCPWQSEPGCPMFQRYRRPHHRPR